MIYNEVSNNFKDLKSILTTKLTSICRSRFCCKSWACSSCEKIKKGRERALLLHPIKNWFMVSVLLSSYRCTREVAKREIRVRVARGDSRQLSNFPSAFHTTQRRRTLTMNQLFDNVFPNFSFSKPIECVHMTSRGPCWRSKQRNGGHVGGVKYSFGN